MLVREVIGLNFRWGKIMCRDTCSRLLRTPLSSSAALDSLPFSLPPSGADADMDVSNLLTSPIPQPSVNRFQVLAGQSLEEWEKAGWIWSGDPRGWAEWYVRFWDGRRCEDDERQVKRCGSFSLFLYFFRPSPFLFCSIFLLFFRCPRFTLEELIPSLHPFFFPLRRSPSPHIKQGSKSQALLADLNVLSSRKSIKQVDKPRWGTGMWVGC